MKRVLFLLMIATCIHADQVADLEKAIMESDLPVVEKLLAKGEAISQKDQMALISLATSVLQKREDLRTVCEMKGWVMCDEIRNGLNDMIKVRDSYRRKDFIYAVVAMAALAALPAALAAFACCLPADPYEIVPSTLAVLLATSLSCFLASCYYLHKYTKKETEIEDTFQERCDALWDAAVKIRQLLYKITPITI